MSSAIKKHLVGVTDLAWQIAEEDAAASECKSVGEWIEWLILCQRYSVRDAIGLWNLRRQRGGRGGVIVLPDDAKFPP